MEQDYNLKKWSKGCPNTGVNCRRSSCGIEYVFIPAALGDDQEGSPVAPKNGSYNNAIVYYEATGNVYLYSSDGVPTRVEKNLDSIIAELQRELNDVEEALSEETSAREAADAAIEQEIEDLRNEPDVVDIVGTYADLQAYNTSDLGDKDIIRVLVDETHDDESTYYRWDKTPQTWTYIGAIDGYYTKDQTDTLLSGKQNVLTAGDNISITNDTISAVGTTYTAGNGLNLSGTEFSVDTTAIQEKLTAGSGIDITNNTISATNTLKAKTLTTTDYNYQDGGVDFIALWLLDDGIYYLSDGVLSRTMVSNSALASDGQRMFSIATIMDGAYKEITVLNAIPDAQKIYVDDPSSGAQILSTDFLFGASIVDNVTTSAANKPLSAKQGKVLKDLIDAIPSYADFIGTDGTTAGTSGLVPAPATTDAGKFLKADGTWETVQAGGGATIFYKDGGLAGWGEDIEGPLFYKDSSYRTPATASEMYAACMAGTTYICSNQSDDLFYTEIVAASNYSTNYNFSLANIEHGLGYDCTIASYISDGTEYYNFYYNEPSTIDVVQTTGSSTTNVMSQKAVTTGLAGKQDTLTAGANITIDANNVISAAGGGSGPTVVQATGTSTTDVMSQNAATNMVFPNNDTQRVQIGAGASTVAYTQGVAIGRNAHARSTTTVAIGSGATAEDVSGVAIGNLSDAAEPNSVALGGSAVTSRRGEVNVGTGRYNYGYNSTPYRVIGGVHDGQTAHDVATVGQLNGRVLTSAGAPTTSTVGTVGQLYEDTTNGKLYICTDATNPYVWEEVGSGGGGGGETMLVTLTKTTIGQYSNVWVWSSDYTFAQLTANPDAIRVFVNDWCYESEGNIKPTYTKVETFEQSTKITLVRDLAGVEMAFILNQPREIEGQTVNPAIFDVTNFVDENKTLLTILPTLTLADNATYIPDGTTITLQTPSSDKEMYGENGSSDCYPHKTITNGNFMILPVRRKVGSGESYWVEEECLIVSVTRRGEPSVADSYIYKTFMFNGEYYKMALTNSSYPDEVYTITKIPGGH